MYEFNDDHKIQEKDFLLNPNGEGVLMEMILLYKGTHYDVIYKEEHHLPILDKLEYYKNINEKLLYISPNLLETYKTTRNNKEDLNKILDNVNLVSYASNMYQKDKDNKEKTSDKMIKSTIVSNSSITNTGNSKEINQKITQKKLSNNTNNSNNPSNNTNTNVPVQKINETNFSFHPHYINKLANEFNHMPNEAPDKNNDSDIDIFNIDDQNNNNTNNTNTANTNKTYIKAQTIDINKINDIKSNSNHQNNSIPYDQIKEQSKNFYNQVKNENHPGKNIILNIST